MGDFGAGVRALYPRVLLLMVLGALILGVVGWHELYPDLRADDVLFNTVIMFALSYDVPAADGPPPLALNVARYLAALVSLTAVVSALLSVWRLLSDQVSAARAIRATGHVLILGSHPSAVDLALSFARDLRGHQVVVIGALDDAADARMARHGVRTVDAVTNAELRRIVRGARHVLVNGTDDEESARLAGAVEDVSGGRTADLVLFDDRVVAEHWDLGADEPVAVCRAAQVAIGVLRRFPPHRDELVRRAPVVVGDGPQAGELVRHVLVGWQSPAVRVPVLRVGADPAGARRDVAGLGVTADELTFTSVDPDPYDVVRVVAALETDGDDESGGDGERGGAGERGLVVDRDRDGGRRADGNDHRARRVVYVAAGNTATTVPLAARLADRLGPEITVVAVVDKAEAWERRTVRLRTPPALVPAFDLLSGPEVLDGRPRQRLAALLLHELTAAPDAAVPGALRPRQNEAVDARAQRVTDDLVAHVGDLLAAGGVALGGWVPDLARVVLGPGELAAVADATATTVEEFARADRVSVLGFVARLPVLAARAGYAPHRAAPDGEFLTPERLELLAEGVSRVGAGATTARRWAALGEDSRAVHRSRALRVPVALAVAGLDWRPAAAGPPDVAPTVRERDLMARVLGETLADTVPELLAEVGLGIEWGAGRATR